jgi:hypothetical protein
MISPLPGAAGGRLVTGPDQDPTPGTGNDQTFLIVQKSSLRLASVK